MATIKTYTDLQQSKKLAEILPLESADMVWANDNDVIVVPYDMVTRENVLHDFVPCWSLSALLGVLPQSITKYIKTFHLNLFRSHYYCCSYCFNPSISDDDGNNTLYCVGRDNWIDACVAMIEKLHELNLL